MRIDRKEWMVPASLIALSLVPAFMGTLRVIEVASGAPVTPANARFMESPLPVLLHVIAAVPYALVGAFQFMPGIRRRHPRWHRAAGRLLVACGLVVALTGLWMAHCYAWPAGDGQLLYVERLVVGTAMLAFILAALAAVRRRDFRAHGAWMVRAYALGLGAGSQVFTHLPWFALADGPPGESARAVMMGAGWVINAVVAEWIIRRGRARAGMPLPSLAAPPVPSGS